MHPTPLFAGIEQVPVSTRGHDTRTPTFYRDLMHVQGVFPARLAALRRLLPDARFVPLRLAPGVGLISVDCFAYRDCDLGPYDEISIAVVLADPRLGPNLPGVQAVALHRRLQGHAFVVDMPVTTDAALALGVDYFGFPKVLGEIAWDEDADGRHCRLVEDGRHVLTLHAAPLATPGRRTWQAFAHLWMQGQPQLAEVRIDQLEVGRCMRPGAARLELAGDHPLADELRGALLGTSSVELVVAPRAQAVLFGPDHLTLPLIGRALARERAAQHA